MRVTLLFPGQGSQYIGMGRELYDNFLEAKEILQQIDEVLQQNLSKLMLFGDIDELSMTANVQPAIMAVSMASLAVLQKQSNRDITQLCNIVAGHSLGEYSALCAAGALNLTDTAKLLRVRGNAMQAAVSLGKGAMAVLIGLEKDEVQRIIDKIPISGICEIANDNSPNQIVISGDSNIINYFADNYSKFNLKKFIKLPITVPCHSSLMQPASIAVAEALKNITINPLTISYISNVEAKITKANAKEIQVNLVKQVTDCVRWRETIETITKLNHIHIEVGAGHTLGNLMKRVDKSASIFSVDSPASIEKIITTIYS